MADEVREGRLGNSVKVLRVQTYAVLSNTHVSTLSIVTARILIRTDTNSKENVLACLMEKAQSRLPSGIA